MKGRVERLREIIKLEGMEAVLVSDEVNREYLSGFKSSKGLILITENSNYIILNSKYLLAARETCRGFKVIDEGNDKYKVLKEIIFNEKISELSVEGDAISINEYTYLKSVIDIRIKTFEKLIEKVRLIKDESEIENISRACQIGDQVYKSILKYLEINREVTEIELARLIEIEILKRGCKSSFEIIVASGINGAKPHHKPTENMILEGELVTVDFGVVYKGYRSDMTRTFAFGRIEDKRLLEVYNIVLESQNLGVDFAKANLVSSELDSVCRDYIDSKGFLKYFVHGTGHGVGLEGHESVVINKESKDVLSEGSVITVEPGIYIEGLGGVRIEDTIVIKNGFSEVLTKSSKELITI